MPSNGTVLVIGATGKQGGAVAHALLKKNYMVQALCRNPFSLKAKKLKEINVEVIEGNFYNTKTIIKAARYSDAAFFLTTFIDGIAKEAEQGIKIAESLKEAGVMHIVYSSVASADKNTGVPHFETKLMVEKRLATLGVPYTIIAPVAFMENLFSPWSLPELKKGKISNAYSPNRKLQQIAVEDIGSFAAEIIALGAETHNKRFEIAGDEISWLDAADTLSRITGKQINYVNYPIEALKPRSEELYLMTKWLNCFGYSVDIKKLHEDFPQVGWHTFDKWARKQDWNNFLK